ncbi:MAG: hypothetical protein R2695_11355 [Acidimicrobiales bacterium]
MLLLVFGGDVGTKDGDGGHGDGLLGLRRLDGHVGWPARPCRAGRGPGRGCERIDHSLGERGSVPHPVASGNQVGSGRVEEPHDLEVPRRFAVGGEHVGVVAVGVVVDQQRHELGFDRVDERGVRQHVGAELSTSRTPRHLLEQEEHRPSGPFGFTECLVEPAQPLHPADFDGLVCR